MDKREFKTVDSERLMVFLRNVLRRQEDGWSDLVDLLPGCLIGTELVVHGERPREDLEDLALAVTRVLEGIYARRENPASQLDAVTPQEIADRLERLVPLLRNMRSAREVDLDLEHVLRQRDEHDAVLRSRETEGHDDAEARRLRQQMCQLAIRIDQLSEERERLAKSKRMVLESLVSLDGYLCIRRR